MEALCEKVNQALAENRAPRCWAQDIDQVLGVTQRARNDIFGLVCTVLKLNPDALLADALTTKLTH